MGTKAAIVAPSGSGKTVVLQALTQKLGGAYLYVEEMTRRAFVQELASAVGVHGVSHSIDRYKSLVVEKLRGTRRPIFLDEAHRLKPQTMSIARTIHDRTGCPIIMAGAGEILALIDDTANGGGQLHSRCLQLNLTHGLDVAGPDTPDRDYAHAYAQGQPLFTVEEVRRLFAQSGVRFAPEALAMLAVVASIPGRGCLRTVRRVVELLVRQDPGRTITRTLVMEALGLLFADAGIHLARLAQRKAEPSKHQAAG
jgi:hypothetical protein